jgi:hypothetical protein
VVKTRRVRPRLLRGAALFSILWSVGGFAFATDDIASLANNYLDHYFQMFPTRATQAGRHDLDSQLEDFSRKRVALWIEFNQSTRATLLAQLRDAQLTADDRLDGETLLAQIDRELHSLGTLARAERDPLYWSAVAGDATVFLLVRDDLPLVERQAHARARAQQLPRFAREGRDHFAHVDPTDVEPEFCQIAAGQLRATAKFYQEGFAKAVNGDATVQTEGGDVSAALNDFAATLDDLAKRAKGSVRSRGAYPETFRIGTGIKESPRDVLSRAQSDLATTKSEAAGYGRSVWAELIRNEPPPKNDVDLLRRLFDRIAADHGQSVDDALAQWRTNVDALNKLVHQKRIMTLPDPLT